MIKSWHIYMIIKAVAVLILIRCSITHVYADPSSYILNIQLSPAVCRIDPSQKRARQCLEGYPLTVSGLYPQGSNRSCETSNMLNLTPVQKRVLMRIMPDENQQARLWRSVGGCVAMNANQYFRLMTSYAERLKVPAEVSNSTSLRVSKEWLQKRFLQLNSGMTLSSIELQCGTGDRRSSTLLTNIQVCYKNTGRYISCPTQPTNSCPDHFVIQGSY